MSGRYERENEILAWMKTNRPWATPWLAIDDQRQWFSPNCSNLLLINRRRGLTFDQIDDLQQMLHERVQLCAPA
jgi:hypothetical protein